MAIRHWLFGSGTLGTPVADAGLLVLRVVTAALLIFLHGVNKVPPDPGFVDWLSSMGFPAPMLFAWLAALAETVGALLIALGLLARPAALYVFGHFVIVVLVAHAGDTLADRELPILFGTIALALMLTGPGRFAVDAMIGGRTGPGGP